MGTTSMGLFRIANECRLRLSEIVCDKLSEKVLGCVRKILRSVLGPM